MANILKLRSCQEHTSHLIQSFKAFFTIFGLPTEIVTDNGPPFNSIYSAGKMVLY